jgi:hypothetical protein
VKGCDSEAKVAAGDSLTRLLTRPPARPVSFAIAALLSLAGCSASAICTSAGGTYAAGTCTRPMTEDQRAFEQQCEGYGGVYLTGQDTCEFGTGGP